MTIVVFSTGAIFGASQLRLLQNEVDYLLNRSLPVFALSHEIEQDLGNMHVILQKIGTTSNGDNLNEDVQSLAARFESLRYAMRSMEHASFASAPVDGMIATFAKLEANSQKTIPLQRAIIAQANRIQDAQAELVQISTHSKQLLKDLVPAKGATDLRNVSPAVEGQVQELALRIEAVVEHALRINGSGSSADKQQLISDLETDMRGIFAVFNKFPESQSQAVFAAALAQAHDRIFGAEGLIVLDTQMREKQARIEDLKSKEWHDMAIISALGRQISETVRAQVLEDGAALQSELWKLITEVLAVAAALILVLGMTHYYVVERQINRRIVRLTKSVQDIAGGDTEAHITVSGPDELGEMARSLETFRKNADQLVRSNSELEEFAYAAAHDLRSPLLAIQDLTDWTLEDEENTLSSDSSTNLLLMQTRVSRLNTMLNGLLEYSRVGRLYENPKTINLEKVVYRIAQRLDRDGRFEIRYNAPLKTAVLPLAVLETALAHLVSNAIKHHDRDTGKIVVSASSNGTRIRLSVADDGPGISPQYHARIFDLFQTLRPKDELEAAGLGLAIIRKLSQHYNGVVQVDSDPETGRGAVFTVDLPDMTADICAVQTCTEPKQKRTIAGEMGVAA